MHPADWMPSASEEDVPELYAPWRDWTAAAAARTAVIARGAVLYAPARIQATRFPL